MVIKRILLIISVAILFTLLVSCQPDITDNSDTETLQTTTLTLATINELSREYRNLITKFNTENGVYEIEIIEYDDITLLTLDLTAGNTPDMLYITMSLPYMDYVSNDLFENLYPYIDADSELCRDDFVTAAIQGSEIDGCLYSIFPDFYIYTLFGNPAIVGTEQSWNLNEFENTLNEHPDADAPFGMYESKINFLMNIIRVNIDEFIDIDLGSVYFDYPEFVRLLNMSDSFPADRILSDESFINTGRQIAIPGSISNVKNLLYYKVELGGDIVIKGWPSNTKNNHELRTDDNSFAILTTSANKVGAWSFLRRLLDKDWQLENTSNFPSNRDAFNHRIEYEASLYYYFNAGTLYADEEPWDEWSSGEIMQITDDDVNMIKELVNSASVRTNIDKTLENIIRNEIMNFVNGTNSAEDTAMFLQNRISLYASERN